METGLLGFLIDVEKYISSLRSITQFIAISFFIIFITKIYIKDHILYIFSLVSFVVLPILIDSLIDNVYLNKFTRIIFEFFDFVDYSNRFYRDKIYGFFCGSLFGYGVAMFLQDKIPNDVKIAVPGILLLVLFSALMLFYIDFSFVVEFIREYAL